VVRKGIDVDFRNQLDSTLSVTHNPTGVVERVRDCCKSVGLTVNLIFEGAEESVLFLFGDSMHCFHCRAIKAIKAIKGIEDIEDVLSFNLQGEYIITESSSLLASAYVAKPTQ
jgi:hypothetical protein